MKCGEKCSSLIVLLLLRLADSRPLAACLLQHRSEFHRQSHIAGDSQLALHEGARSVEFALDHFVEGIERNRDGGIGALARAICDAVGIGLAVNQDTAGVAEVELQRAAKTGIGADCAAHLVDDLQDLWRAHGESSPETRQLWAFGWGETTVPVARIAKRLQSAEPRGRGRDKAR
jgi:hypothetical protein